MMDKRFIDHILWDWNGTLLDDAWLCVNIMDGLLRAREMEGIDLPRYRRLFGFPVRDYYRRLGFDFEREPFEVIGTAFIEDYERRKHECKLQTGARAILERFERGGLPQSVLSAYRQDWLHEMVEGHDLQFFFEELIGLDDHYAHGKISLARRWLRRRGIPPQRVLLIGDTTHDAEVAAALGCRCLLVEHGHQQRARLEACNVPVVADLDGARQYDVRFMNNPR